MTKHAYKILPFLLIPLLSACAATPGHEVRNDKLEITGTKAYILTCEDDVTVEVKESANWRKIKEVTPPDQGKPYYMNGKPESFSGIRMWCDNIECVEYTPITASLLKNTETIQTGVRQPGNIPEYETRKVTGDLRATVLYYPNQKCEQETQKQAVFLFSR